ncbi:MAG: DUF5709 domain-containing protein [Acidimicrobiales bacterium]
MSSDKGPVIPSTAEATDGDGFGEEVGDQTLPGTIGFPPADPAGVGPADSLRDADHHDSLAERIAREEPEGRPPPHDVVRLVDPNAGGQEDDEPELIGDDVPPVGLASPEEAAMHLEDERDDPGDG